MVLLNCSSLQVGIVLVKQWTIVLEHYLHCIERGHIVLYPQGIHRLFVGKYVLFVEAKLHLLKCSVTRGLCVTSNINHKFRLLKELHFNKVRGQTENVYFSVGPS
jgi:hypothetical protein